MDTKTELERAYRAIRGFYTAAQNGTVPDKTMLAYHSPTTEGREEMNAERELNPLAMDALENHQRQLDRDGVEVGVSRQALDELIAAYDAIFDSNKVKLTALIAVAEWAQSTAAMAEGEEDRAVLDVVLAAIGNAP